MGSVYQYDTEAGKRWEVRHRRPNGKSARKGGFRIKREAEAYLTSVEASKLNGQYIAPRDAAVTIAQLGPNWLAAHEANVKQSTYRVTERAWRLHVEPEWGSRAVGSIRHSEVKAWVAELAAKKSATVVRRSHGISASILDDAVQDRRIPENPARRVKLPKNSPKKKAYLTHQQVEQLALASKYPDLIRFLAYTGLRWGVATGLRVRHVDLANRRVRVEENAVRMGATVVVGSPKTGVARSVSYPAFLDEGIKAAMRGKKPRQLLWGDGETYLRAGNAANGWFPGAVRRCQEADRKAENDVIFPGVTPHDLRHTAASLAVSSGANVKVVQRMLGHTSAAMTLDTYADLFEDDTDSVAMALDTARARALGRGAY